ncbi:scarecrow-like protein 3 [Magnolia sinica]|uniref:scarecrow-like protein 3 n=1 Tax=Magnolia sinica TaxID=86752 RepID=UPI00265A020E|nr:scarecrow-like protein 3 [Magnolia sinica]
MDSSPPLLKKPSSDVTLTLTLNSHPPPETLKPEDRGLRLIQLLLTCVAHASSGNLHRADTCLRHISHLSSVSGDSMQRLAAWFASSLAARLIKRWPGLYRALSRPHHPTGPTGPRAWLAFSRALPYLGFAHTIIQRTVLRAMSDEQVVHIIDIGSGDPNLWAPLLLAFALSSSGPPHLKITCINANRDVLDNLSARLVKEAEVLDIPFQFNPLNVGLKDVTIDMLKVRTGEAVAVCSVLSLHTLLAEDDLVGPPCFGADRVTNVVRPCKQMDRFMSMVRSMSPKVFLLVEQESDHNSARLVDRFLEGLHYYSAMFDSVEAAAGSMTCHERLAVEEMLGREIESVVACEGVEREERHERAAKWMVRIRRSRFRPVRLWGEAMDEGRRMVESFGRDGYKVVNEKGFLMICWHERPIYAVSAWQCS